MVEATAAAMPGIHGAMVTSRAPIAGPRMKPSPNAAPIRPMPFARSSGPVMSAITAWAVEMLPPEMPSMMREAKSIPNDPAMPKRT